MYRSWAIVSCGVFLVLVVPSEEEAQRLVAAPLSQHAAPLGLRVERRLRSLRRKQVMVSQHHKTRSYDMFRSSSRKSKKIHSMLEDLVTILRTMKRHDVRLKDLAASAAPAASTSTPMKCDPFASPMSQGYVARDCPTPSLEKLSLNTPNGLAIPLYRLHLLTAMSMIDLPLHSFSSDRPRERTKTARCRPRSPRPQTPTEGKPWAWRSSGRCSGSAATVSLM